MSGRRRRGKALSHKILTFFIPVVVVIIKVYSQG
jgi:hypothetical protein